MCPPVRENITVKQNSKIKLKDFTCYANTSLNLKYLNVSKALL